MDSGSPDPRLRARVPNRLKKDLSMTVVLQSGHSRPTHELSAYRSFFLRSYSRIDYM